MKTLPHVGYSSGWLSFLRKSKEFMRSDTALENAFCKRSSHSTITSSEENDEERYPQESSEAK